MEILTQRHRGAEHAERYEPLNTRNAKTTQGLRTTYPNRREEAEWIEHRWGHTIYVICNGLSLKNFAAMLVSKSL